MTEPITKLTLENKEKQQPDRCSVPFLVIHRFTIELVVMATYSIDLCCLMQKDYRCYSIGFPKTIDTMETTIR